MAFQASCGMSQSAASRFASICSRVRMPRTTELTNFRPSGQPMASFAMGIPVFSETPPMACAALNPLGCQNRAPSICIRICIRLPWFGSVMPL